MLAMGICIKEIRRFFKDHDGAKVGKLGANSHDKAGSETFNKAMSTSIRLLYPIIIHEPVGESIRPRMQGA